MSLRLGAAVLLVQLLLQSPSWAQKGPGTNGSDVERFHSEVPAYDFNVILGRPTDHTAVASVHVQRPLEIEIHYGPGESRKLKSPAVSMAAGSTHEFLLDGLPADSSIGYDLHDARTGEPLGGPFAGGSFHTARPKGSEFTFTIQADSHLDSQVIPSLYEQTLENAATAGPDFHFDLGDTFMSDKIDDPAEASRQYLAQRYYLGRLCHSVPLFLVLGNHDGEAGERPGRKRSRQKMAWSETHRTTFFPNPVASPFYRANSEPRQNYYAFDWGDALFVVLDPFRYSQPTRSGAAPWNMTLGQVQYHWLAGVLRSSRARFKFVLIHQLTGGIGKGARGGREAAGLYEWGGRDERGQWQFDEFRPGWEKPIHPLLKETGVSAVFHGHDHFFAYQPFEDIVYQLVPQPSHRNHKRHLAAEYGYESGAFLPNSGHLRVEVTPERTTVSYIRSANNELKRPKFQNGEVAFSYEIVGRDSTGQHGLASPK